jgi:hypothetical protein
MNRVYWSARSTDCRRNRLQPDMSLFLLLLRARALCPDNQRANVNAVSDVCSSVLRRARRDRVPVVHFYPRWPAGDAQLPNCGPRQLEQVLCSVHELCDALVVLPRQASGRSPACLLVAGVCDLDVFQTLVRCARARTVRLDLAKAGFKLLPRVAIAASGENL